MRLLAAIAIIVIMSSCSSRQKVNLPEYDPAPIRKPEPGEIIKPQPGDSLYFNDSIE